MIGVFVDGVRVGTIAHFTDGPRHRFWAAYADNASKQFKTRKAAAEWLIERHSQTHFEQASFHS